MKTTLILAVSLCLGIHGMVFGQVNRSTNQVKKSSTPQKSSPTANSIAVSSTSCCGQTEIVTEFSSPEEEIRFTQLSIHLRLLDTSNASTLAPGVHVIGASREGYRFQATVNQKGVVSDWFVTDPWGFRIAQVNSNGGGNQVDVNRCMEEFLRRTEFCEWQGTFDSRYNYGRCYWEAWRSFLGCLESGLAGQAMR